MKNKKAGPEQVFPEHEGKFFEEDFTPRDNYDVTPKADLEPQAGKHDWQFRQDSHKHNNMLSIGTWASFKGID